MSADLRYYRPEDARALSDLYGRSIRALASADYSREQIEAWAALAPTLDRLEALMTDGRRRYVATQDDVPVAFLDLEPDGHIQFLYRAPEAEPGVTSRLLTAVEASIATSRITRLFTEASEPARRFFQRHGFRVVERRDFDVSGVAIHNYAMVKDLT